MAGDRLGFREKSTVLHSGVMDEQGRFFLPVAFRGFENMPPSGPIESIPVEGSGRSNGVGAPSD